MSIDLDPTFDFIAGNVSVVKVRFQTPEFANRYGSIAHAMRTIAIEEGFIGLYKGVGSPLATVAVMNGLVFSSYNFFLKVQKAGKSASPTLRQVTLAGAGSGVVSSIVTTPTELIKIRQQSQTVRTSTVHVALDILRKSGVPGLYRGITITAFRDIGYGTYFLGYEGAYRFLSSRDGCPSWLALLVAGGIAGITGWIPTFPFDVVKTRIQATERSSPYASVNPYRNTWSTVIYCYRTEGMKVFFRGLAPTLVRAIPVNMATLTTFETIVHSFR
ncbi:mitochondrial carrier [Fistulina hepatica ATCC 64428]|nr:mitochondrial carrier [Fistulina hepatica ATCC 64428]